jgi:hypothetical protein
VAKISLGWQQAGRTQEPANLKNQGVKRGEINQTERPKKQPSRQQITRRPGGARSREPTQKVRPPRIHRHHNNAPPPASPCSGRTSDRPATPRLIWSERPHPNAKNNFHPNKPRGSIDSGSAQSVCKFPRQSNGRPEPTEARPKSSNSAGACRYEPKLRRRSTRAHPRQSPASNAWPPPDRFADISFGQPDHVRLETRYDVACQIAAHAQRWRGKGCNLHRKKP